jgi:hypothetical protein
MIINKKYIIILSILVFAIGFNLSHDNDKAKLSFLLNFDKCGGPIELYINNLQDNPIRKEVVCKQDFEYDFQVLGDIKFIRIDLSDSINNKILIKKITYLDQRYEYIFKLDDVINWKSNDLKKIINKNNYLELITDKNDPFIYTNIDIKSNNSNFISQLKNYSPTIKLLIIILLITILTFPLIGKISIFAIFILFVNMYIWYLIQVNINFLPVLTKSIGLGSYNGYSLKGINFIIYSTLILFIILFIKIFQTRINKL